KPPPRLREARVRIVAAGAAAFHITESECILGRAPESFEVNHVGQSAAGFAPEADRSNHKNHQTIERNDERRDSHRSIGHPSVESSLPQVDRRTQTNSHKSPHQNTKNT